MPPEPPQSVAASRKGCDTFAQSRDSPRFLYPVKGQLMAPLPSQGTTRGSLGGNHSKQRLKERSDTSTPMDKSEEAPSQISVQTTCLGSETKNPLEEPHHHQKKDNLR
jgi:hypothetical protein